MIFEVREWPIIRDLQFTGMKAVQESDVLKEFREKRVGVSKEAIYDPVKARNASRILRELLAGKGYPNAKVNIKEEEVSATSIGLTFEIEQGNRSRIIEIDFTGNEKFRTGTPQCFDACKGNRPYCQVQGARHSRPSKTAVRPPENVRAYMWSKAISRHE